MLRNKKSIFTCLVGILIGILLSATFALAEDPIKIIINGKTIQSDVAPQMIDNRVFVPVRVISENLNCSVAWDSNNNAVVITSNEIPEVPEITETPKVKTTPIETPKTTTVNKTEEQSKVQTNNSPSVTPVIIERYEKIVDQNGKDILTNNFGAIITNNDIYIPLVNYSEVSKTQLTYDLNSVTINGKYYSIKTANTTADLIEEDIIYKYQGLSFVSLNELESRNLLNYLVDETNKVLTLIKVD